MIESFLHYPFLQRALLASILVGFICALLGVFVVLNRMAFFVDALAHSALTGIALGILIGFSPLWTAVVFGVAVAVGVVFLKNRGRISADTALGLFMPFSMALGIFLLQLKSGYSPDLLSYLFGSILAVSWTDLAVLLAIGLVSIVFVYHYYSDLIFLSFDRDLAYVAGVRVAWLEYLLMIILGVAVIASLQVAGIVLVGALVVIPAAAAKNIAKNFWQVVVYSILFGLLGSISGLVFSYIFNVASGAMIVLCLVGIFLVTTFSGRRY